jgi:WD40 repeat protein
VDEIITTSTSYNAVATGDFNGDGKLDFAAVSTASNSVTVFLGNGDGTFNQQTPITVGSSPAALAIGDFNGDGKLDLAVVNKGSNTVSILLGNGNGTFTAGQTLTTGSSPSAIVVGNFTNSGHQDLAVANSGAGTVSIFTGNGDGTFMSAGTLTVGTSPDALAVGDFNGDGKQDLAVANSGSNNVSVLLGNGNGTFASAVNQAVGTTPVALVAADFNGDGVLDLATAANGSGTVSVLTGGGDGTFASAIPYTLSTGSSPVALSVVDAGTGFPSLVVLNQDTGAWSLLVNPGSEFYEGEVQLGDLPGGQAFAMGNFDGSGVIEALAVGNPVGGPRLGLMRAPVPNPVQPPKITGPIVSIAASQAEKSSVTAWINAKGQGAIQKGLRGFGFNPGFAVKQMAFNPSGTQLAVIPANGKKLYVYNVGATSATLSYDVPITGGAAQAVTFSPDGKLIALGTGDEDGFKVRLLDATKQGLQLYATPKPITGAMTAIAFSPSGKTLVYGDDQNKLTFESVVGNKLVYRRTDSGYAAQVSSLSFGPGTALRLAVGTTTGKVYGIALDGSENPKSQSEVAVAREGTAVGAFTRDNWLVTGDESGNVTAWKVTPGAGGKPDTYKDEKPVKVPLGKPITSIVITADGKSYLVAGPGGMAGGQTLRGKGKPIPGK